MNILFLTQIVPYPPDSGPRVKTYHVLRYLASHGHQVTLATYARDAELPHIDKLRPYCAAIHAVPMRRSLLADVRHYMRSLRSGLPFLVTRDDLPAMRQLIGDLVRAQQFDIVHADQLTMGQFALAANGARRVFDAHNAVWKIVERAYQSGLLFLRPVLAREARLLKAYEGALCQKMDAVLAVSTVDRAGLIEAGASAEHIHVIPIAVDCDQPPLARPCGRSGTENEILIVSTLYYPPNADGVRWFLRKVFPLVRKQVSNVRLTIVGARPPADIAQFGAHNADVVSVTGYVADLKPIVERAAVMVVPVRAASGMRVRILEALAQGIPVVSTTMGAEGIDVISGQHLMLADEPEEFARSVAMLLQDHKLSCRLAKNGRRLIEDKYDWRIVLPGLESVYRA